MRGSDPGIFVGGGGPAPTARKQPCKLLHAFFSLEFLVLNLFYSLKRGFIAEKRNLRGSNIFRVGDPTNYRGGPNADFYRIRYDL